MYIIYSHKSSSILNFVYKSERCSILYKYTYTYQTFIKVVSAHTNIRHSQKSSLPPKFVHTICIYTCICICTLYIYIYIYQTFLKVISAYMNIRYSQKSSLPPKLVHTITAALTFEKHLPVARARGVGQDGWRQDPHSRHQQNGRPLCLPRGEILKKPIFTKPTCL